MARINIEDSLFKTKSFMKLIAAMGSARLAIGAVVEAFIVAQDFYIKLEHDRLIPLEAWKKEELAQELIDVGFAEVREKGIYLRGSEEHFKWLAQKSEAGKSKSTVKLAQLEKARDAKNLKAMVNESQVILDQGHGVEESLNGRSENTERNSTAVNGSEALSLSLTLTPSLSSSSSSYSKTKTTPVADAPSSSGDDRWRSMLEIYNANRGPLPQAKAWNSTREKLAKVRWKELPNPEQWALVVKYYASSPHHTGSNDRGWVASFDFILQPGRWLQAAEAADVKIKPMNQGERRTQENLDVLQRYMEKLNES